MVVVAASGLNGAGVRARGLASGWQLDAAQTNEFPEARHSSARRANWPFNNNRAMRYVANDGHILYYTMMPEKLK